MIKKEYVDGFLLGDGGLGIDKRMKSKKARFRCTLEHKEFCEYLIKPFEGTIKKYNHKKMKQGFGWYGCSKYSKEAYKHYLRWYKEQNGKISKQVPEDVVISPTSVMMWYLGDGSVVHPKDDSRIMLRLSTDGFDPSGVELLVEKLNKIGIVCHRNNDNRVQIKARGIPYFFQYIGRTSPVKCYDYKFDLPIWRFESKRMSEVAGILGVSYNRLSHLVKIGRIDTYRLSEKGRPRFLPRHIKRAEELIKAGELY
jgi:hypothetical protein